MKKALIVAALLLASRSQSAAFVHPSAATAPGAVATRFTTNSLRRGGASSAITPPPGGRSSQQRQQLGITQPRCRSGRGRHLTASLSGSASWALASVVVPSASFLLSWGPRAVGAVVATLVAASVVNALQGGVRGDLGLTQEKILGVPAEEATADHVNKLGKARFVQLFHASPCPPEGDLDGEYPSCTLPMGVLHPIVAVLIHRVFGPGRWLGKGLRSSSPEGYNLFSSSPKATTWTGRAEVVGDEQFDTKRGRRFRFTPISPSAFDAGNSASLDYSLKEGKNGLLFTSLRDEVRKVNDRLYVGLGYMTLFGGKYNCIPFLMEGPPLHSFSGPDDLSDGKK